MSYALACMLSFVAWPAAVLCVRWAADALVRGRR